jgi:ABC-type Fe3+/spermidine/putrescine transport system ATPase subunit
VGRIYTTAEARVGARLAFLIREEQIRLQGAVTETINHVRGRGDHVRRRGKSRSVSIGVGSPHRIEVRSELSDCPSPGEEVTVLFPPDAVWVFPEARR